MSLTRFEFTKDWNNPNDFPTTEDSEINVRRDMQSLHDEAKDGINRLIDELESTAATTSGAKQIGIATPTGRTATNVQALLNAYNTDIAELDETAHTHANKGLLDTYNQTNANLTDAVSKKHSHTNLSALESVPSGGVVTTLGNDNTTIPTSKAVADALSIAGHGDMLKSSYDTTNTGNKVDTARNAEKLGGQPPSYYAKASDIPSTVGDMTKANYDPNNTGNKVATAQNAEKLNGQVASYYAAASSLSGYMAKSAYDSGNTGSKVDTAKNAEKLNGQLPTYYATASALASKQDTITSSTDLTVRKLTGGLNYDSSAPAAANTYGIKFVVLSSEPATKQDGWLYIITDSE